VGIHPVLILSNISMGWTGGRLRGQDSMPIKRNVHG
jgi:hypothetical protein